MRRTRLSRAFSAATAVWLAVSLAEPTFLHACPVHGAGLGAHSVTHATPAHAGHHGSVDSETPAKHDSGQPHTCTCLGNCCCATPIGLAAERVSLTIGEPTTLRDTGLPAYSYVPIAAEHILPFQNGPPALI